MRHLTIMRQIEAVARTGSIRKAAEELAIAPSALNRRIQNFEAELGERIFERLPRGVRLNPAGELLLHLGRRHLADMERLRGQIADLAGIRRGHVAIACSQAVAPHLLPAEIARYAAEHPAVTFEVRIADHGGAERALADYSADLALVIGPTEHAETEALISVPQTLHAVMAAGHPLARKPVLRLRDCVEWPLAAPSRAFGGRRMLERAAVRLSLELKPAIVSNSFEFLKSLARRSRMLTFQLSVGAPAEGEEGLVSRPIAARDMPPGSLLLCQLRGRILPIAASRFAMQVSRRLAEGYGEA